MNDGGSPARTGGLQLLLQRWPLLLAVAFTIYSALLLSYAVGSSQRMRADANGYLVADNVRRAAALGDRAAELQGAARVNAGLQEIRSYLANRDLGMSPRYGLNVSRTAIAERFRQRADELARRWEMAAPRIVYFAADGERIADSAPEQGDVALPLLSDTRADIRIDAWRGTVAVAEAVLHKEQGDGIVVTISPIDILYRNLLPFDPGRGYRELLLTIDGRRPPGRDSDVPLNAAQLRLLAGLADNTVLSASAMLGASIDDSALHDTLLVKTTVPGMPLVLATFVPEKMIYGHLVSRSVMIGAIALLLMMLLGSFKLDRMRRQADQLAANVAAAEQQRALTEFRNVELSAEIRRREEAEQERSAAEARILDRNEQLSTLFALSPDGFVSFDRERRVKYANPAFLAMTGYVEAELIGLDEEAFSARLARDCRPETPFAGLPAMRQAIENELPRTAHADSPSASLPHKPRLLIELAGPVHCVIELKLRLAASPTVAQILYARDVTHEMEVDRMKSEFLSHAAHELRTPMASIFGFTEILMTREFDAATRKDLLATIHRQTQRLVDIINELLDLSRIEARRGRDLKLGSVRLAPLVEETLAALRIDQRHWPVSVAGTGFLPPVRIDAAKLTQALNNVLANAIKYSPGGGAITIRGMLREQDGKMRVGLSIADQGIGMTPEQVAHVGERFWRADTSGSTPGTGLGMAIVKEILVLLGGSFSIDSAPGSGTTVTLWLPAAATPDEPIRDETADSPDPLTDRC
jgi:signal transduction histidine kinase